MKILAHQLYQDMLNDLQHCKDKGLPHLVESECCFRISEKYCNRLREQLSRHTFPLLADEIHFFKEIKPKFIAEPDYYGLLNYAGNFCPEDAFPEDQKNFWIRQLNRLDKFKAKYAEFYMYYLTKQTDNDAELFTRGNIDNVNYVFDRTASSYDLLIAQLLAHQRYVIYAGDKLRVCMDNL